MIRLHDLHPGHVTSLLASGVPVEAVPELLGHAGATITPTVPSTSTPHGPPGC